LNPYQFFSFFMKSAAAIYSGTEYAKNDEKPIRREAGVSTPAESRNNERGLQCVRESAVSPD
jgi:hypothetical protein